eukprot:3195455-Pleurochrysis_carterae.AAC.2
MAPFNSYAQPSALQKRPKSAGGTTRTSIATGNVQRPSRFTSARASLELQGLTPFGMPAAPQVQRTNLDQRQTRAGPDFIARPSSEAASPHRPDLQNVSPSVRGLAVRGAWTGASDGPDDAPATYSVCGVSAAAAAAFTATDASRAASKAAAAVSPAAAAASAAAATCAPASTSASAAMSACTGDASQGSCVQAPVLPSASPRGTLFGAASPRFAAGQSAHMACMQ